MIKIKCAAIYKIEHVSGYSYVGKSIDLMGRWQSHYTDLKLRRHSSKRFQELWDSSKPSEWSFSILEYVSMSEYKKVSNIKPKDFKKDFNRYMLLKEKQWMSLYSKTYCLNQNDRYFS